MRRILVVSIVLVTATWFAAGAAAAQPVSVALDQSDRQLLVRKTCVAPSTAANAEVQSWRANQKEKRGTLGASVLCPMPQSAQGQAAYRKTYCQKQTRSDWTCDAALDAIPFLVAGSKVLVTYRPEETRAIEAIEIADYIGNQFGYTFSGRNLRDMMRAEGECLVDKSGQGALAQSTNYRVSCGNIGVIVTKHCTAKSCRIFPAFLSDSTIHDSQ